MRATASTNMWRVSIAQPATFPLSPKITSTEMVRDYREAEIVEAKRLYEPKMTRQANVPPAYRVRQRHVGLL